MNLRPILTALTLSLVLPIASVAQTLHEAQDNKPANAPENARTPTSLLELLPEDDKGWPKSFSLILQWQGVPGGTYMSWEMGREGMDIVLAMAFGEADRISRTRLIYSSKGELKGFRIDQFVQDAYTRTHTGKVVDDNIEVTLVNQTSDPDHVPTRTTKTVPLERFQDAFMLEWVPLIVAYHARQASFGYTVSIRILEELDTRVAFKAIDIGTEQVEIAGEKHAAHVLLVDAFPVAPSGERQADSEANMTMIFLETGGFVEASLVFEGMKIKAKRATRDEIDKRFGNPQAQAEARAP